MVLLLLLLVVVVAPAKKGIVRLYFSFAFNSLIRHVFLRINQICTVLHQEVAKEEVVTIAMAEARAGVVGREEEGTA